MSARRTGAHFGAMQHAEASLLGSHAFAAMAKSPAAL